MEKQNGDNKQNSSPPDDRLMKTAATPPASGEPPRVFAITDLRKYVKPPMGEELTKSDGGLVNLDAGVICTCVPVEMCVCHVVTYNSGASDCSCTGTCSTGGGTCYWYYRPY